MKPDIQRVLGATPTVTLIAVRANDDTTTTGGGDPSGVAAAGHFRHTPAW